MTEEVINWKTKRTRRFNPEMILWMIRILLIDSILLNGLVVVLDIYKDQEIEEGEIPEDTTDQSELVFLTLIALILTFLPDYIEKKQNIHFP